MQFRPLIAACFAAAAPAAAEPCSFEVTPQFSRDVVLPAAAHVLGHQSQRWDLSAPAVFIDGATVKVVFAMRPDAALLDPPYFVIIAEACGQGPVRSGLQDWDVATGLRPAPAADSRTGYLN